MAARIYSLTVTVPAGTAIAAPVTVPWVTEDNVIESIEIMIPPGHNGQTGVRIVKGDVQILPYGAMTWITGNDYYRNFTVGDFTPTTDLTVQAYNTGAYPHSFYLRMEVTTYHQPGTVPVTAETAVLPLEATVVSTDPLSPDSLIGAGNVAALASGDLTPAQLAANLTTA